MKTTIHGIVTTTMVVVVTLLYIVAFFTLNRLDEIDSIIANTTMIKNNTLELTEQERIQSAMHGLDDMNNILRGDY